ncbi:hypothetical protein EMIT0P176_120067 [Pseudomonas sp. IT-P176]
MHLNGCPVSFDHYNMDTGKLRRADSRVAALHLRALLESEWLDLFLFSTMQGFDQTFVKTQLPERQMHF